MRKTLARRWLAALLTLTLAMSLAPAALADPADDLALSKTSLVMKVGDTETLTLSDGTDEVTTGIDWESSDEEVAAVEDGKVTAVAVGDAEITAEYDGKEYTCLVTVATDPNAAEAVTYTLSARSVSTKVGAEADLPEVRANGKKISSGFTWASGRPSIATVSGNSKLVGVAEGTGTLTVTFPNGRTEQCSFSVTAATMERLEVELDKDEDEIINLEFGGDGWLGIETVTAVWSDIDPATNELRETNVTNRSNLVWSATSSDERYVSLPEKLGWGAAQIRLRAEQPTGKTEAGEDIPVTITVTVNYNNKSATATCKVVVGDKTRVIITEYNTPNSDVSGSSVIATMDTAKTLYAFVTRNSEILSSEKVIPNLTWNSYKPGTTVASDVVTVTKNSDGSVTLTPVAQGKATVTATYQDPDGEKHISSVTCVVRPKGSGGTTAPGGEDDPGGTTTNDLPKGMEVVIKIDTPQLGINQERYVMETGSENITATVTLTDKEGKSASGKVEWTRNGDVVAACKIGSTTYNVSVKVNSSNSKVAFVTPKGTQANLTADQPGTADIRFSVPGTDASATLPVEVSGFELVKKEVTVYENESMEMAENVVRAYGGARFTELSCWSDASNVAAYIDGKIAAYSPGTTTFHVGDSKRGFQASFDVEVKSDPSSTIPQTGTIVISSTQTLEFADLLSSFRRQAGGKLAYITGINLNSSAGAVLYKYNPTTEAGTGVGAEKYYHPYTSGGVPYGQRSLEELTFVPKKNFAGEAVIHYTGVSEDGKNYVCKLLVTVDPQSGSNAGISLSTDYNTPLKLSGDDFSRVCRERLDSRLSYVTFSQPPERQGTLYTNYVAAGNYGSRVDSERYSQKQLDDVWFVPAPGFPAPGESGRVTVYYTAFSVDGKSYAGQVDITVNREDEVAIGGLTYDIAKGGVARFDDGDFQSYCRQILDYRQTLSYIQFNALPTESEGVLYSGYSSASNSGSRASTGTTYYYGSRSPRIDNLAFVPAANFVGTVKIPFTGYTANGTRFNGNVEVNVRGGAAANVGDITYICAPGRTVSFDDSDFNRLSRNVTGSSLNYITFRSLPGSGSGTLYYNNTQASTSINYRNGSSTPRIDNLSFTAASRFSGTVDIPFTGRATNGDTFRGVVTIGSSASALKDYGSSWNSGASATIFTDMGGYSDIQRAAVDFLYDRNITRGLTTTQYGPQNSIRRGDFARMLYQAFSFPSAGGGQAFVDVPLTAYYAEAVNALYSRGVVSGIGGGLYAPDSTLTRQDAICMVQRAMRASGRSAYDGSVSALYSYNDGGSVSGYAQGAMAFAVQNGYLPTYGDWLNPTQPLTRIDMAEILYRVLR